MAEDKNFGYTPNIISKSTYRFFIPIYQRLFAWGEDDIQQLLDDLWESYTTNKNKKYYIGILTAIKSKEDNNKINLVDGQQRFTVMTLIAIVLRKITPTDTSKSINWESLLKVGETNTNRLSFTARQNDENYINNLISAVPVQGGYENYSMKKGIECIEKFFTIHGNDEKVIIGFSEYIYNNLTFFISYLPEEYDNNDVLLNKYFESMNSKGKPLENYDILKVELLKKLQTQEQKSESTLIWNNVYSDFQKEKDENENSSSDSGDKLNSYDTIFDLIKYNTSDYKDPKKVELYETKSLFSFPLFLLLVRYKQLMDKQNKNTKDENKKDSYKIKWEDFDLPNSTLFFNTNNLLSSFKQLLTAESTEIYNFFKSLDKYNNYLKFYFINKGNGNGFEFSTEDKLDTDKENSSINDSPSSIGSRKKLEKFQSMLYVSSYNTSYYKWFIPALEYLDDCNKNINDNNYKTIKSSEFLEKLKEIDNNEHKEKWSSINTKVNDNDKSYVDLNYQNIDRYWFWRLDYYLWENEDKFFEDSEILPNIKEQEKSNIKKSIRNIVVDYKFQRNRSIEHISPQKPQCDTSDTGLSVDNLHLFGNLAMISSGQNSSLQNASFEEKKGHVKAFINGSKVGSIESLKMLHVYTHYDTWNDTNFGKHQELMLGLLNRSFGIETKDKQ